jgi:cell division septation protein DedD
MNLKSVLTVCSGRYAALLAGAAGLLSAGIVPVFADPLLRQTDLVSDVLPATINDPNLTNASGISEGPSTPFWISDNRTGVTTLYRFMRRRILAVAIAAALSGIVAAPALAQNSESAPVAAATPMKSKPKPKTPAGGTVTVTVTNSRKADLDELLASESGSASWKQVLGALKSGEKASAKVPQGNNCRVDLHGNFADGQAMDASNVDVCADKTVNLTD